jgi:uncharacterized protein (DUF4415 family)
MSTKSKMNYGNVEVTDDDIKPEAVRRRISIFIPEDVIMKLTAMAKKEGIGYQTLINRLLHDAVSGDSVTERLERIERQLELALPKRAAR